MFLRYPRSSDATNANLQIMFDTTCCDGPCSNPATGTLAPDSCNDCGVCCSANLDCEATCVVDDALPILGTMVALIGCVSQPSLP